MSKLIRLDKYLADMSLGTRSQVKIILSKGRVQVNNIIVKDSSKKINPDTDTVSVDGTPVIYKAYEYYMLNKPAGIITATYDKKETTVVDLIESKSRKDLFPVGRLDRDTEGLLLITNNGDLGHRLLSPKSHIDKTYYVNTDKPISTEGAKLLEKGIDLGDFATMPANLKILEEDGKNSYLLTIKEGKFHQVKRMFEAIGSNVIYLKRISMGTLILDENLEPGQYRTLNEKELEELCITKTLKQ